MDIEKLMAFVVERWRFDAENYPGIEKLFAFKREVFALRHILMHQAKALGKAMEAVEPCDHGERIDEEKLRLAIRNSLINTLRLAEASGMSADDLLKSIENWAEEKSRNQKIPDLMVQGFALLLTQPHGWVRSSSLTRRRKSIRAFRGPRPRVSVLASMSRSRRVVPPSLPRGR